MSSPIGSPPTCRSPGQAPRATATSGLTADEASADSTPAHRPNASTLDGWRAGESPAEVLLEAIAAKRRTLAEHDVMLALLAQGVAAGAISVSEGLRLLGAGNR